MERYHTRARRRRPRQLGRGRVRGRQAGFYTNFLLTPKIGTGKRLTCGPNLVEDHHSAEGFP
jgi:hypothetical protein